MDKKTIAIQVSEIERKVGTGYPPPYDEICKDREKAALGDLFGLTQFGVNVSVLPPKSASSQRHWHLKEDEFIYVISGNPTLITDEGETQLSTGMVAGFKAGDANGHYVVNKSDTTATILEIGSRSQEDEASYPDIDLHIKGPRYFGKMAGFTHKDGTDY